MNLRSFARKIIRANGGVSAVREAFCRTRYGDNYGKNIRHNTRAATSESNAKERRKRLLTFIPKETPEGKDHRLMEESKRMKHRKSEIKTTTRKKTAKKVTRSKSTVQTVQTKGRGK